MTDKFRSDYLMEADEYIPDEEKSQTPTEDQTDDEFGVDQYDGSEMTADEPSADDGEIAPTYGDDEMMAPDESSDEEAGVSDISEIYSIVSEFFPDEDEQKVKDWIESTMETENISTEAEFLDLYDDAEAMENSYKSFGGDEDAVEAEKEATEPEEESEKDEDEDDDKSEPDEDEKEPVKESKKSKLTRKKRLSEGGGAGVDFDFTECAIDRKTKEVTGNLKLSSYDNYLEYDDIYGSETVGRIVQTDEEILRMIKSEFGDQGVNRVVDLSFTESSKYMYGGGYIRKPLRPNSKIPVEVRVDVDGGDDDWYFLELDLEISDSVSFLYTDLDDDYDEDDLTESKKKPKLVKEAYSENLESSIYDYVENQIASVFGEPVYEVQDLVYREIKYTVEELDDEIGRIIRKAKESGKFNNQITESKKKSKLVKEAYSEDLSKELQLFMTIKTSTQSDFVKKLATEAIEKIRAELKKPADQPKTPVTESVRDRIRAKLRANRK